MARADSLKIFYINIFLLAVVIQAFRIYSSHRAGLKPHYFVKWRAQRGVLKEFRSKLIQKVYLSIIE